MDMTVEDLRRLTVHQRSTNEAARNELFAKAMRNWAEGFKRFNRRYPTATELSRKLAWLDFDWALADVVEDLFPVGAIITRARLQAMVTKSETRRGIGEAAPKIRFLIRSSFAEAETLEMSPIAAIEMLDAKMLEPIPLY